jgi:hypothetical protein
MSITMTGQSKTASEASANDDIVTRFRQPVGALLI